MSIFSGLLDELVQPVIGLRATEYTIVACAALWTYEYLLTLDREIYFVWGSKWSLGKVLFFLNRYSPIIDTVLAIYILTGVTDPKLCPSLAKAISGSFVGGMFISEIVLAMRTHAIWGGRRSILIFLVCFTLAIFAAASVLTNHFLNSLTYVPIPAFLKPSLRITCAPLPAHGETGLEFMVFMVNQTVIAILTLYRALQQYRVSQHPLIRTMFQDGLLYYIYALILSAANVAVALALPVEWGVLLELPLRVISSICCTRVLLNIRGAYFNPTSETSELGLVVANKTFQGPSSSTEGTRETGENEAYSEDDHFKLPNNNARWKWEDNTKSAPRLSLGPMAPFQLDISEIEVV